ncbi:MAG TPA: MalM family protein [Geobacteraceae bacterium]
MRSLIGAIILAGGALALQACSTSYATASRHLREAPACCTTLAELPSDSLRVGEEKSFDLGKDSPAFDFAGGKSFFRAFALPGEPYPYRVTVSSFLVGDDLRTAYLFSPQLVTLDADHRVVRATGPGDFVVEKVGLAESLREGGRLRSKLVGGLDFPDASRGERYLVVLTSDELRRGTTPVPRHDDDSMLFVGLDEKARKEMVRLPNGAAGRVRIAVAASHAPAPTAAPAPAPAVERPATQGLPAAAAVKAGTDIPASTAAAAPALVTARLANGRVIVGLELGRSTVETVRTLFGAAGADVGPEAPNAVPFVVGTARVTPKRLYTPPSSQLRLYFDEKGVLVAFVDGASVDLPATGEEFLQRFPAARETGRTMNSYELQTPLSPCVTLVAVYRTLGAGLDSAAYVHACPQR